MRREFLLLTTLAFSAAASCSSSSKNPDATGGGPSGGSTNIEGGSFGGSGATAGVAGAPFDAAVDVPPPTTYAEEVISDNPSLYWRELGTAPMVDDVTANLNHGEVFGCVNATTSLAGDPAFDFCGGWIQAGNIFSFAGKKQFTFEAWVKADTQVTSFPRIAGKEPASQTREGWTILFNAFQDAGPADLVLERWQGPTAAATILTDAETLLGGTTFAHLVVSFDGTNGKIYLNGQQLVTKPSAAELPDTNHLFRVGADGFGKSNFRGALDEIAVYEYAVPIERIKAHYDRALSQGL